MTHSENLFDKTPETLARERAIGMLETCLAERGIPLERATFHRRAVIGFSPIIDGWMVEAVDNFGRAFRQAVLVKA